MNTPYKERETVKMFKANDGTLHESDQAASEHEMKAALAEVVDEWFGANGDMLTLVEAILERFDVSEKPHWNAETIGVAVDKKV